MAWNEPGVAKNGKDMFAFMNNSFLNFGCAKWTVHSIFTIHRRLHRRLHHLKNRHHHARKMSKHCAQY